MFANYLITTISHVQNIVQAFGNIFTIQSSLIPMIGAYILLTQSQRQILKFIRFEKLYALKYTKEGALETGHLRPKIKFLLSVISQFYMYLRLLSIYNLEIYSLK